MQAKEQEATWDVDYEYCENNGTKRQQDVIKSVLLIQVDTVVRGEYEHDMACLMMMDG